MATPPKPSARGGGRFTDRENQMIRWREREKQGDRETAKFSTLEFKKNRNIYLIILSEQKRESMSRRG